MPPDLPLARSGRSPLEVARRCANEAARIVLDGLGKTQDVRIKGRGNLVTASDLASERAIHAILRDEYPEHSILSGETAATARGEGWMWVVDPLDGTRNYLSA